MPDWASLRAEFPLLDRYVYLNACSLGPLPLAGKAALEAYARAWLEKGTPAWYSDWLPVLDRLRSRVAELLHAPAGSTAIAPSVSVALGTLASGLPMPRGRDKVLIGALDFPTIGHQWLSRPQFEVEFVPSDVDWRPGRVRLSPHWCVTEAELEHGTDLVLQHVAARK